MSLYDEASLVMIPSGYKDDKLYSIKPTSGDGDFTFSRDGSGASPATRVNASGLIEKGRTNELLQSNSFDTSWTSISTTETAGQSGYDGSSDAWLLSKTASSGRVAQLIATSGVQTASVYAKSGTLDWVRIVCASNSGDAYLYFDLANGVKGTDGANTIDSTITSVGGGWYRLSITFDRTLSAYRFYPADGDGDTSGTSGNIYIQDAQLEKGLVATDYIETTTTAVSDGLLGDMPRLDYSGGASCPSLLLEPSRTNLLTQSELFSGWSTIQNVAITNNNLSSPEGVQNAAKITDDSTSGNHRVFQSITTTAASHTFSIFLKKGTMTTAFLRFNSGSDIATANVDLDAGIITATAGSATIEDYGNDWYRCSITGTAVAGTSYVYVYMKQLAGYSGSGQDMYLYGAQVEAGSYPTSYIPTYGSATARAQDQAASTGLTSTLNSSEGVLYAELKWTEIALLIYLSLSDGTNSNRVILYRTATNNVRMLVQVGGVTQASLIVTQDTNEYVKVAVKYKPNDFAIWVNGTERGTDTSGSTFSANTLNKIGFDAGLTGGFSGSVKQAIYFDSALTDAELESLTTI